jgi:chromosome segregation ATPase
MEDSLNSKPMTVTIPKTNKVKSTEKAGVSEKEQKKYQQKIQVLTNQLTDTRKELEKVEKNAQDWKVIAEKNEKSLNILSDKLLDPKDKAKKMGDLSSGAMPSKYIKQQLKQQERILELDTKLLALQARNEELEKLIEVEYKVEQEECKSKTKDAKKKLRSIESENISLRSQVDKLIAANSTFDKNEEAEYARQMNIKSFENRIRELEMSENELHEELLKAEHKNLDMKFERENSLNKIQTLKDKIDDLETYIQIHALLPSVGGKKPGAPGSEADQALARATGLSKRSNEELEKVIDGLKRVINSQKTEIEQLKKKASKISKQTDKVSTNKLLKDEIDNLEKELQTIEQKETEITELRQKAEKLSQANRALMNDVSNEQKRYEFLESKYKDLLVKYNVTSKDLEKKQDSLFSVTTGANRATYQEYLTHKENLNKYGNDHEE